MVAVKPSGALNLNAIRGNFSAVIISYESEHQRIGEWPRFASAIPDIFDRNPRFFQGFAVCGVLDGFTLLNKTGNKTEPAGRRVFSMDQECRVVVSYQYNNRRRESRIGDLVAGLDFPETPPTPA